MAWDPIDETELTPGKPILKHVRQVWNCLKFLYGSLGTLITATVQNGSFEIDSDSNGQPDNWVLNTYPGGVGGIATDVPAHGVNAVKLVHPGGGGNGGGYYESDYVICSELQMTVLNFIHWATAAGMHNQVVVRFFDKAKVHVSDATLYDSTANPTAPMCFVTAFTPPATARFYKLDLIGGNSDTNVAGTAYFDGVGVAGMEMLTTKGASFTLAEQSSIASSFTDVSSTSFAIPFTQLPVALYFLAECRLDNYDDAGSVRFRVGSAYSSVFSVSSNVYSQGAIGMVLPADASGRITVYMQLVNESLHTTYGKKSVAGTTVRLDLGSW